MRRQGYHCTPVIPRYNQTRPERHVAVAKSYKLAKAIDKYYIDCINKGDLWPDPGYVAQMIKAVYDVD